MKGVVFICCILTFNASAARWHVGSHGLATIHEAVQVAAEHDTIYIDHGTYREGNIVLSKPLTLIGSDYPILDGEGKSEIITVRANNVHIEGIHFFHTGTSSMEDLAGVKAIHVSNMILAKNRFERTFFGIHISNSTNCTIRENTLWSSEKSEPQIGNGIHLWRCDHMTIEANEVHGHRDGIYFEFVTRSLVTGNVSYNNLRYGLHFMFSHEDEYHNNTFRNNGAGVAVMYSKTVKMSGNHFDSNQGPSSYGLLLKDIRDSEIGNNHFTENSTGIYLEGCSRSKFERNHFNHNGWAVRLQASCDENVFAYNDFTGNSFDVATNGSLSLNTLENNYWDRYEGYDLNHDGVGDIPFRPVSLYGMIVEKMPTAVMLWRSLMVSMLDRAEKVIPSVTPVNLVDASPRMRK